MSRHLLQMQRLQSQHLPIPLVGSVLPHESQSSVTLSIGRISVDLHGIFLSLLILLLLLPCSITAVVITSKLYREIGSDKFCESKESDEC